MQLDLININQASNKIDRFFFYPFYENLYQKAKNYNSIRLAAPIIALIDAEISLIQIVGAVAEALIKASANILKAVRSYDKVFFLTGTYQLLGAVVIIVFSIPKCFLRFLIIFFKMIINPIETSEKQMLSYKKDPNICLQNKFV